MTPDWETWQEGIPCPRCGYDLRMLAEPRCPECGLRSTWRELTARKLCEERTGSFEYWWRRRPVRSLAWTLWRCMFPWLLWPRIPLVAEPRIWPLAILVVVVALLNVLASVATALAWAYVVPLLGAWPPFRTGWYGLWWTLRQGASVGLCATALTLAAGVLALAAMFVFRESMRRYRIRGGLILRIAVLAWCGFALWTMIVSVTTYFVLTTAWTLYLALEPMFDVRDLVPVPCYVVSISLAWAVHLRVRRGWVVGPLALALTVAAFFAGVYLYTFEIVGTVDNDAVLWARYLWPALTRALIYVFLQVAV